MLRDGAVMELFDAKTGSLWGTALLGLAWIIGIGVEATIKHWRTRLPMKRANDEHIEKVMGAQIEMGKQQERTATAINRMADKVDQIGNGMAVLLDRSKQ